MSSPVGGAGHGAAGRHLLAHGQRQHGGGGGRRRRAGRQVVVLKADVPATAGVLSIDVHINFHKDF